MSDNILFRQPESSHLGDCPICILPLPLDTKKSMMQSCCTKRICIGCYCAGIKCEMGEKLGKRKRICPFCRQPEPKADVEIEGYKTRRMEVNDPVAIREAGKRCYHQGDYESAFEYFSKAAESSDAEAHYCLSFMYRDGNGVGREVAKRLHHLEEAAIGGHPKARHNLGVYEVNRGRIERGVKHFIIAAKNGHDGSVEALRELHTIKKVGQEDFDLAFLAHQAVVDATKSPQREAAQAAMNNLR